MQIGIGESIGMDLIHAFFALLDSVIYGLIGDCYDFINKLTEVRLSEGILNEITSRIYLVLGIFMLFKVSSSFINYIVNPDSMLDKEKGVQKVIINVVVMFIMLVSCSWAFDKLYDIQDDLLTEGTVENFIFGTEQPGTLDFQISPECGNDKIAHIKINKKEGKGDFIALTLFKPFYQLSRDIKDWSKIGDSADSDNYCRVDVDGKLAVSDFLKPNVYNRATDWFAGTYNVSYLFGISTAVGVVALLIIINMLLDISLRTVKLMFLQLIAPIPIISYIDPKSGKNGIFMKWLKEVGNTWVSLFIRLFAFNFAVFMIQQFTSADIIRKNEDFFVNVFLILGALMFAKQLPKIIQDITGIKLDGGFNINPMKKIQDQALGGKLLGKTATAAGGLGLAIAGAVIGHNRAKKDLEKGEDDKQKAFDKYKVDKQKYWNMRKNYNGLSERDKQRYKVKLDQQKETMKASQGEWLQKKEKYDKQKEEYDGKFSNKHFVAAGLMEALRGTKIGFSKGAQKPTEIITNSIEAAKMAAKEKNQHDIFPIKRRVDDFITDIAGVKNSSGTTSEYKKELKTANESLKDIGNYIQQLNHSFAGMMQNAPQLFSYEKNQDGVIIQKTVDAPDSVYQQSLGMSRKDVERMITELRGLRTEEKNISKRINELNDSMNTNKNSK